MLEKILLDLKNLLSRIDKGKRCIKYEQITVTDSSAVSLNVPGECFSVLLTIEEDSSGSKNGKAVRITETGQNPTSSFGMPLGDLDSYEVTYYDNIKNIKLIGVQASKAHTINVVYYAQS